MKGGVIMMKTALISVFDKENILALATSLQNNGVEIISTGGTFKYLKEKTRSVRTGFFIEIIYFPAGFPLSASNHR